MQSPDVNIIENICLPLKNASQRNDVIAFVDELKGCYNNSVHEYTK